MDENLLDAYVITRFGISISKYDNNNKKSAIETHADVKLCKRFSSEAIILLSEKLKKLAQNVKTSFRHVCVHGLKV